VSEGLPKYKAFKTGFEAGVREWLGLFSDHKEG